MKKVSVLLCTYNQEKYIAQAIESAVNQKTDFEYEILVGDDCSQDKTPDIVKKYAEKYPGLVKAICREKNLGASGNEEDLIKQSKGEYIALLEGDDFWTDENKLQKQVDFLDSHPDYAACFGKIMIVDENSVRQEGLEQYSPYFDGGEYTVENYQQYIFPGQTASSMYRRSAIENIYEMVKHNKKCMPRVPVVDVFMILAVLSQGRIYTSTDIYAAYRYVTQKGSGTWSSKHDFYSVKNVVFFLYQLKELERVGREIGIDLDFDEKRNFEFDKVAMKKGEISIFSVQTIRFFIWLWYRDKHKLYEFVKGRHKK